MMKKFLFLIFFCFIFDLSYGESPITYPKKMLAKQKTIPREVNEIVIGYENAPITMIEYSSLTCKHCADFHINTWPHLQKKYIDTGKVKFIFRHFPTDADALKATAILIHVPLPRQPQAINEAFKKQDQWLDKRDYQALGRLCGLEEKLCKRILQDTETLNAIVELRVAYEKDITIEGTPTFVINGQIYARELTAQDLDIILNGSKSHDTRSPAN